MEIVKQTGKELVLKSKFSYSLVFCVFLWIGIPLLMVLMILWEMGVIRVSCQRVEPTQVNCQVNQSRYLGLTQDASTSLTQVTEAKVNSQKSQDNDGNTLEDYFMTLLTQKGKKIVAWQGDSYFNGYPQEMNETATKINTFINNSTESSLVIHYDLRWKKENLISLARLTLFPVIGILLLYRLRRFFYLETVIFSKSDQRLTYKTFSLLGIKIKNYSFAQIKELIIESSDTDNDRYYELELVLPVENNRSKVTLIYNYDIKKVRKLANIVGNFIEIPYQELSNK